MFKNYIFNIGDTCVHTGLPSSDFCRQLGRGVCKFSMCLSVVTTGMELSPILSDVASYTHRAYEDAIHILRGNTVVATPIPFYKTPCLHCHVSNRRIPLFQSRHHIAMMKSGTEPNIKLSIFPWECSSFTPITQTFWRTHPFTQAGFSWPGDLKNMFTSKAIYFTLITTDKTICCARMQLRAHLKD